jgi:predicted amidophosphoribosyltransferase
MNEPVNELPAAVAPEGKPAKKPEAKTCPVCHRKLLTQTSILCNWCGAKIDDPDFLARAAAERLARDEQERTQVEAIAQEEARYGVFGRLKRRGKPLPGGQKPLI